MAQVVKNLPPMQEKDPLEKGLAIHSSILAWRIPQSLVGYSSWGYKESDMAEMTSTSKIDAGV